MKNTCLICGHKTLDSRCDWHICPVCFWEDDVLITKGDKQSPANGGLRVSEAQANYMIYGCCAPEQRSSVRGPLPSEELDPSWQPLPEAFVLAKGNRSDGA